MKDHTSGGCDNGFTLIELTIVIIIIGIILGAVIKGRDVLLNARAKNGMMWIKEWETAEWSYMTAEEHFAGDDDSNGIIADEATPTSPIDTLINAKMIKKEKRTLIWGAHVLYLKLGYDTVSGTKRNVIVICVSDDCTKSISTDDYSIMEMTDRLADNMADAGEGELRGITAATLAASNDAVTDVTEETTSGEWSSAYTGLVYYFEQAY